MRVVAGICLIAAGVVAALGANFRYGEDNPVLGACLLLAGFFLVAARRSRP